MSVDIYKVVTVAQWRAAEHAGVFAGAPVDLADGYIHFSTAAQLAGTLAKHFAGQRDLLLVTVDAEPLGDALRWEVSRGGARFPHLYATLPVSAARRVEPIVVGPSGDHIVLMPPARGGSIARDGRTVGWSEWGEASGAPVVFCTGAGMTSMLGFGATAIAERGIRLICVDRAGLGRSSPDPDKSFATYARDVAAVLATLGVTDASVVGYSQGAPFALALAAASLARQVAIVAGTDELAHPAVRSKLPSELARLADAVAADGDAFEAQFATQVDAEGLFRLVVEMSSPHDRALYEQPGFAAAYQATLADGFAQGPRGYVRDFALAMQRWPMAPENVEVPVDLWYGARDASPVHSPDLGELLASRLPHATRHVLPDEGGSLLWTRALDILSALV